MFGSFFSTAVKLIGRSDTLQLTIDGTDTVAAELRTRVLTELEAAGFTLRDGLIEVPKARSKDDIRALHLAQRMALLRHNARFLDAWEERILGNWIADGTEVDPRAISPEIQAVNTHEEAAAFRYATLHWSIPVSQGFGRRTRFLIVDRQNGRLIGVFALGDPVFNLRVRDSVIGWDAHDREQRLYNVLDAFVMGALPPYRDLLGGKLVALLALSGRTSEIIERKYVGRVTKILGATKSAKPVLITTTSALGRSSIYNRLAFKGRALYTSVGYTQGFGHFQFSNDLFHALRQYLAAAHKLPGSRYGEGPNWRIRVLRTGLESLGLKSDLIRHGVQREVFLAPLAKNWKEFLREGDAPKWAIFDESELTAYFLDRWAIPRSERDSTYKTRRKTAMRLRPLLAEQDTEVPDPGPELFPSQWA